MLRVAVIGVGLMGRNHARIYYEHPDVQLVAICDSRPEVANDIAEKYKCKAYYSVDELLVNEKLDGVSIATNSSTHYDVVAKVVGKGINVLIEKPVADNLKDSLRIRDLVCNKNIICVVGHIERYNPVVQKALNIIINKELGKLVYITMLRQGPYSIRNTDVDVLTDLGIHDLEIVNYLTKKVGDKIINYKLFANHVIRKDVYDIVRTLMQTEQGVIISLSTDVLSPTKIRKMYVGGEKALLELDFITQELSLYKNGAIKDDLEYDDILKGVSIGECTKITVEKKEPLFLEINNFIDAINGKDMPFVDVNAAVDAIVLLEKIKTNY